MPATKDRLNQARHGLVMITAIVVLAAIVLATAGARRDSSEMTGVVIKTLNLSTPALFPSGHALRDPGYAHAGVDLRHSPYLPAPDRPFLETRYDSSPHDRQDFP